MHRILILGAGTGGTIIANKICRYYKEPIRRKKVEISVVDVNETHIFQPGLIFIPFGIYSPRDVIKPRNQYLSDLVHYTCSPAEGVDPANNRVYLENGERYHYDVLIIATGARIMPEQTPGLACEAWHQNIFDFYTLEGASKLSKTLEQFQKGRLIINIAEMPIKCPGAPLEFAFLADWYYTLKGRRKDIEISLVTPLEQVFEKPLAARTLEKLLTEKNINVVKNFSLREVKGDERSIVAEDRRSMGYELLISVPAHGGASYLKNTDPGNERGYINVDNHRLQSRKYENIFALGDAADLPTTRAGSVTNLQSEYIAQNIIRYLYGKDLIGKFDDHSNYIIETGYKKAILLDYSFNNEHPPGKFPWPHIGPLSILKESRFNHISKLFLRRLYWNMILPGIKTPFSRQF